MMSIREYAADVEKSVEEILNLCNKLGIKVSNEEDMLSEDDIILLDNELVSDITEDETEEMPEENEETYEE